MVNRGPSKGCETCRQRRIKCDETRPSCQKCMNRGVCCLGYRSMFDRSHRDVTDITRRRYEKTSIRARNSLVASKGSSLSRGTFMPQYSTQPRQDAIRHMLSITHSIPARICQDYEAAARDWFIAVFAEHPSSTRANADFLLYLHPMLHMSTASSPLHKAVSAVAVSFASVLTRDSTHADKAFSSYAAASRLLRKSINHTQRRLDDDVLMTTLMLELYDSVNGHFLKVTDSHEFHLMGALALIDYRKSANYKDDASKAMVNHVQNAALQHALHTRQTLPPDSTSWFTDPSLPRTCFRQLNDVSRHLTDLLAKAERLAERPEDTLDLTTMINDLVTLDDELVGWYNRLPADCYPVSIDIKNTPPTVCQAGIYRRSCDVYKNLQTATMLNLWRSRRLMLLHRLLVCMSLLSFHECISELQRSENIQITWQWLTDGICGSVPFFVGDLSQMKPAILAPELCFPSINVGGSSFPESYSNHIRHATASGAWLMMEPLIMLCHFMDEGHGSHTSRLRAGQEAWIKQQLRRLHPGGKQCKCGKHVAASDLSTH